MYKVFVDFKDGTHREQMVQTEPEANALKDKWQSEADFHDCGFELVGQSQ